MTKGVHFDKTKNRWIAKFQKNHVVKRKGFINRDDAVTYRIKLEKGEIDMNDQLNQLVNQSPVVPKNCVRKPENKTIVYHGYWQQFTETDTKTGETRTDKFYVPTVTGRIIHQDSATVFIFDDGNCKGVAKCDPNDTFSRKRGLSLAFLRALIKHCEKQIKQLTKEY